MLYQKGFQHVPTILCWFSKWYTVCKNWENYIYIYIKTDTRILHTSFSFDGIPLYPLYAISASMSRHQPSSSVLWQAAHGWVVQHCLMLYHTDILQRIHKVQVKIRQRDILRTASASNGCAVWTGDSSCSFWHIRYRIILSYQSISVYIYICILHIGCDCLFHMSITWHFFQSDLF